MQRTIQLHTYKGNAPQFDAFFKEYELQDIYIAPKNPKNRAIRRKRSEMVCRFCGKNSSETSFKSKPHIISKLFGNNAGISDFECDKCNNHFSVFETNTADFLGVNRTIFSLGKEKVPTFKAPDGSIEARESEIFGNTAVEISAKMPGLISSIAESGKIKMEFKSNSYIPLNVYKCLLKIALTILPDEDLIHYRLAMAFLMKDLNSAHFAYHATQVFRSQLGGEVATPYCILSKKLDSTSDLPTHIFQLYYQDSCLQFHLPYHDNDKQIGLMKELIIPMCPPLVILSESPEGKANYEVLNLSSKEKKGGEIRNLYLNFDKEQIQKTVPVDVDKGVIGNHKFDPDDIVKVYFARDTPENL